MKKLFPLFLLVTCLGLSFLTAPKASRANTDATTAKAASEEQLSRKQRDALLSFMRSAWTIGEADRSFDDDIDYADSINLWFADEEASGTPWWQIFGALLSVSEITNHITNDEFGKALEKTSELYLNELIGQNARLNQLAGFQTYASLATLTVSIPLNAFVDMVDRKGFENQMEAYKSARLDIKLTHEQISRARPNSEAVGTGGVVYFGNSGWIDRIGYNSDVGGEWAGLVRNVPAHGGKPLSSQDSGKTYDLIRLLLISQQINPITIYEDRRKYVLAMQAEIDRSRSENPTGDASEPPPTASAGVDAAGDAGGGGGGGSIEPDGDELANSLFVDAVKMALGAVTLNKSEREKIYEGVGEVFDRIVSEYPNSRPAAAIASKKIPGIDFALLAANQTEDAAVVPAHILRSGLFAIDHSLCGVSQSVGDAWGTLFQSVSGSSVQRGSERDCDLVSVNVDGGRMAMTANCSVEGETEVESWAWQVTSETAFSETEGRHAGKSYTLCGAEVATETAQNDAAQQPTQSTGSSEWGPEIVVSKEVPADNVRPCENRDVRECLRSLGVNDRAIDFALAFDAQNTGYSVARTFVELGERDLVKLNVIYAPYEEQVIINGSPNVYLPEPTQNLRATFQDEASQSMLRQFPNALNLYVTVASHRILPDGTQRFVLSETVFDRSRAGPILGSAVSFLDYGPSSNGSPTRTPIGLLLSDPSSIVDMTAEVIRNRPASLQAILNTRGYSAGPMDGYPGPQTRQALMQFQVEHCLPPTGQPDTSTVNALFSTDGFSQPCQGSSLPNGVVANMPLEAGVYVNNPGYCDLPDIPDARHDQAMRLVGTTGLKFGYHQLCNVRRTDIRNGITLFRGSCAESLEKWDARWQFDVKNSRTFIEISRDSRPSSGGQFSMCPADSALAQTWAPSLTPPATQTSVAPDIASNDAAQLDPSYLVAEISSEFCEVVSPAFTEAELLQVVNNHTFYGTSPEDGRPWKWRFENLAATWDGVSYFETPEFSDTTPTRIANGMVCEKNENSAQVCETVHFCVSGEIPFLTRGENGGWTKVDAAYPNAASRDTWQHFGDLASQSGADSRQNNARPTTGYSMDMSLLDKLEVCTRQTRPHLRIECLNNQQF